MTAVYLIGLAAYLLAGGMLSICIMLDAQAASKSGIKMPLISMIGLSIMMLFLWPIALVLASIYHRKIR